MFLEQPKWKQRIIFRLLIIQRSPYMPIKMRRWLLNYMGARIDPTATVNFNVRITNPWMLTMGPQSYLNAGSYVDGNAPLDIGAGVRIGSNVTILTSKHNVGGHSRRCLPHEDNTHHPVTIGSGSWLGAGVIVMPGVTVAPGCIIGAQSLVTRNTEPDGLYVNMAGSDGVVNARRLRDIEEPHAR